MEESDPRRWLSESNSSDAGSGPASLGLSNSEGSPSGGLEYDLWEGQFEFVGPQHHLHHKPTVRAVTKTLLNHEPIKQQVSFDVYRQKIFFAYMLVYKLVIGVNIILLKKKKYVARESTYNILGFSEGVGCCIYILYSKCIGI